MSEASKPTPGPWLRDRGSGFDCDVRAANGRRVASVNVQNMAKTKQQFDGRKSENEANAALIAEAGTVHHETGLTPRQLLEQRDMLVSVLDLFLGSNPLQSFCIHKGADAFGRVMGTWGSEAESLAQQALAAIKERP